MGRKLKSIYHQQRGRKAYGKTEYQIFRLSKEEMKASRTSMPYVAFPGQSPIPKARGKTLKSLRRKLTGKNK